VGRGITLELLQVPSKATTRGAGSRAASATTSENYKKRVGDIVPKRLKYKKLVRGWSLSVE
jgi:hypothetical protein